MECWLVSASTIDTNLGYSKYAEVGSRTTSSENFLIPKSIEVINGNPVAID